MYRKISDFTTDWKHESDSTLKLFNLLTDEAMNKESLGEVRKIGRLSWHIAQTIEEMMSKTGLTIDGPKMSDPVPATAKEVYEGYKKASESLMNEITKWTDEDLLKEDNMYGQQWMRGITLSILIKHQAHHRGQLTVLMRYAGLKIVGVYGPSKEEWVAFGMPAQE